VHIFPTSHAFWFFTPHSPRIFLAQKFLVCGNLSTCYKFPSAALPLTKAKRTRTRFEARIYLLIIYARLARSRRKSSSVVFGEEEKRKTKQNVSLILAPVTARKNRCRRRRHWNLSFSLARANCVRKIPHVVHILLASQGASRDISFIYVVSYSRFTS
jgi:hypothetical protein